MASAVISKPVWRREIPWLELRRGTSVTLHADETVQATVARFLDVEAVAKLEGSFAAKAWLDGVELEGRMDAVVTRLCGVSLEAFDQTIAETFSVRIVPPDSDNRWTPPSGDDGSFDLDGADPPDVLVGDCVDLGAILIEQLALALPPFARKPDAVFEPAKNGKSISPFAALAGLARRSSET